MKKGFTLAEVLITLAVIGVVAALTIPVLVNKYQNKQLYTQFMKTYNTIANAMDLAQVDNGDMSSWDWGHAPLSGSAGSATVGDDPFTNYITPQFKVTKICDPATDCLADSYTMLNGQALNLSQILPDKGVVLADGALIAIGGNSNVIQFYIDTNGKKGPNVAGRDLFILPYGYKEISSGNYDKSSPAGFQLDAYISGSNNNCNSSNGNTYGCASKLLEEGAMNY